MTYFYAAPEQPLGLQYFEIELNNCWQSYPAGQCTRPELMPNAGTNIESSLQHETWVGVSYVSIFYLTINFQVEPVPSSENTRYVWQGETRWR